MKTKQKNLLMNLLGYWTDYHNTTLGKDLTWDAPVKNGDGKWHVDIYENNDTYSHNFEYIAMIYKAINASCFIEKEQGGFKYHIF